MGRRPLTTQQKEKRRIAMNAKLREEYANSAEVRETPGRLERELEIETAETKAACDTLSSTISTQLDELSAKHNLERQVLEKEHEMLSSLEDMNVFLRIWRQILTNLNLYRKKRLAKVFKRKSKKPLASTVTR